MLKINVNSITTDPESFSAEVNPGLLDLGAEAQIQTPVQVEFKIHRIGENIYIRGAASTRVAMKCARCLENYGQLLSARLMLLAVHGAVGNAHDGAHEQPLGEEDPTLVYYAGDQLDLLSEVRSALLLALPMKPICAETCQGLCPHCGTRLAAGPCRCDETPRQGPFSALKNYRS